MLSGKGLAMYFDHTLLRADAMPDEIEKLCQEAIEHQFFSVCVQPYYVSLANELLRESNVKICSVVGFPLGQNQSELKAIETKMLLDAGTQEIDMVINLAALKSKKYEYVKNDIRQVVAAAKDCTVKVIIETCLLNTEQKITATEICMAGGAHFVKTSTGFSKNGAQIEDIALIREIVGSEMGVKASGGIRDFNFTKQLIQAGATRLGASSSVNILREAST